MIWPTLILCLLQFTGAPAAKATEVCRDIIGEEQSIEISPGASARVMFFHRGPVAGYIEICKIHGQAKKLVFAAAVEASGWYQGAFFPAEIGRFYLKSYSAQISIPVPHPRSGMRRFSEPYGYAFNWFDSADEVVPNMIVEFCIQSNSGEMPASFPLGPR